MADRVSSCLVLALSVAKNRQLPFVQNGAAEIAGSEAMHWLQKGFGFSSDWTVNEQNDVLARLFGLQKPTKPDEQGVSGLKACGHQLCDTPVPTASSLMRRTARAYEICRAAHRELSKTAWARKFRDHYRPQWDGESRAGCSKGAVGVAQEANPDPE